MDSMHVARAYFKAWNDRAPADIVATFAPGGTYRDPACGGPLTGDAIGHYAAGLFTAFPDLSFEIVSAAPAGDRTVAAQWIMRGRHSAALGEIPATGRGVTLPGADFLTLEGDKIRSLQGYFDQKDFVQQLGLQVIVQPYSIGPVAFGISAYMESGSLKKPGAFSLTRITVESEDGHAEVDRLTSSVLEELAGTPGFISTVLTTVGLRGHTITAWEDAEAPKQLLRRGAHKDAMGEFFGGNFASGGVTSVWVPARINASWSRCRSCGQMIDLDRLPSEGQCRCGAALPEPSTYW